MSQQAKWNLWAPLALPIQPRDDSGAAALVDILLPDTSEEGEPDSDSHSEPSLEPVSSSPEPEREGQEGGATLAVSATLPDTELSQLPVHVHRNISVDLNDTVDRFARKHPRKLQFL